MRRGILAVAEGRGGEYLVNRAFLPFGSDQPAV